MLTYLTMRVIFTIAVFCVCVMDTDEANVKSDMAKEETPGLHKRQTEDCVSETNLSPLSDVTLTFRYNSDISRCTTIVNSVSFVPLAIVVEFEHFHTADSNQYMTFEPVQEGYGQETSRYFGDYLPGHTLVFSTNSFAINYVNEATGGLMDVVLHIYTVNAIPCGIDDPDLRQPGDRVVVKSPGYPQVYYDTTFSCSSSIVATSGTGFKLTFIHLGLECSDSLTISTPGETATHYNCVMPTEPIVLNTNVVRIAMSTHSSSGSGYQILVTAITAEAPGKTCNQYITLNTGQKETITSPNYPGSYYDNSDVSTCVELQDGAIGDLYYRVTDFDVECCCDRVSVNDMSLLCGQIPGNPTAVDSNKLKVTFTSDSSFNGRGFNMTVWVAGNGSRTIDTCDTTVVLGQGEEIIIRSQNFPYFYNANSHVITCVTLGDGVIGELYYQITYFNVECCCDHLSINDNVLSCNDRVDEETKVESRELTLSFTSDWFVNGRGYSVKVWVKEPLNQTVPVDCDTHITLTARGREIIHSPYYPSSYPPYSDVTTCVSLANDVIGDIYYKITKFDLECCCDHLTINDVTLVCGEKPKGGQKVENNELKVVFTSDGSITSDGFKMRVWVAGNV